ncbi:MAG: ABC transporter ATP-binding protein [Brevinema sp.]
MSIIKSNNLTLSYGKHTVIESLDLSIMEKKITILIGSNGCGKSTLLRSIARLLKPKSGSIIVNGHDVNNCNSKELAQQLSILPQTYKSPEGLTVFQLVKQGRYPYRRAFQEWTKNDEEAVTNALKNTNMLELSDRLLDELSGGQRQRAWIAMILAQETDIILLDEPTTYLDIAHQIDILDLLFELNKRKKSTIVIVLHDLNLAARYADYLIAVADKKVYIQGSPKEVMTVETIKKVFNMNSHIITDPIFNTPLCIPASYFCQFSLMKNMN